MKIGLCAWSFTGSHREAGLSPDPHTAEGLAQLALRWGLHSIECSPQFFAGLSPEQLRDFAASLAARSLGLIIDTGGHDLAKDPAPLRQAVETAHLLGVSVVRTTISNLLEGDRRRYGYEGWRQYLENLVLPLKEIMAIAADQGILVGIENHQDVCSSELCWLCEQVNSDKLGVTMDCGNALAVGETPLAFAGRVMPFLKHVHLKDYSVHPTPSGYRLKRCALGTGVVDWPALIGAFDAGAPQVQGCIELGASAARHIRILEEDFWATYSPRPLAEPINALRALHQAARPTEEDWRTPHERGESPLVKAEYELAQLESSVAYLKEKGLH
ncbi:MAG: sugar phosphate isomerase/epimerase [Candidatus Handelsmanbacteria bacterium]|nr:sugar phosphate isomerase/epimerase [Candidatus Handelsmanbacteria bacterium]